MLLDVPWKCVEIAKLFAESNGGLFVQVRLPRHLTVMLQEKSLNAQRPDLMNSAKEVTEMQQT